MSISLPEFRNLSEAWNGVFRCSCVRHVRLLLEQQDRKRVEKLSFSGQRNDMDHLPIYK